MPRPPDRNTQNQKGNLRERNRRETQGKGKAQETNEVMCNNLGATINKSTIVIWSCDVMSVLHNVTGESFFSLKNGP